MILVTIILLTILYEPYDMDHIIWSISYGTYKINADFLVGDGLDRISEKFLILVDG